MDPLHEQLPGQLQIGRNKPRGMEQPRGRDRLRAGNREPLLQLERIWTQPSIERLEQHPLRPLEHWRWLDPAA